MQKVVDELLIIDQPVLVNKYNRKERRARKEPKNIIDKIIVFDDPFPNSYNTLENFEQI